MINKLIEFSHKNNLFDGSDKLLLAVSGGIDSIVLLDIISKLDNTCGIAHCNFNLRGEESDGDEEFVKDLSVKYNYQFHSIQFDTKEYASEKGISIQMAARNLRYEWFSELCKEHSYSKVLLAHQQNDNIETFFINLSRGTGISGLSGINAKNGKNIRPLLFADRDEITEYSLHNNLIYREDSSNIKTKYLRNNIRHNILPLFNKINPRFSNTMLENINRLNSVEEVFTSLIKEKFNSVCTLNKGDYYIDIEKIIEYDSLNTYLYYFLKRFNFNQSEVEGIVSSLESHSGKKFYSSTHRIIKDRNFLIISVLAEVTDKKYYIEDNISQITEPINLEFDLLNRDSDLVIMKETHLAFIDYDKISFPLVLRKWNKGEYFKPFGMDSFKKISDFFIDEKMSIPEKERTWILCFGDKIIWVVGKRLDNRFRIDENTTKVLKISCQN